MINDTWSVIETKTGRKICECSDERDAMMLVSFSPDTRTYSRNRYIMDQVIDVTSTTDKQLPGQIGLPSGEINKLNSFKEKLPEGLGKPVEV